MMKLMSLKQYMNMSKPALIRKIMKTLKAMPKKKLALACYNLTKSKLPQLKKGFIELDVEHYTKTGIEKWYPKSKVRKVAPINPRTYLVKSRRKTKRKFSRKQLAAQRLFAKRARAGTLRR